MRTIRSATPLLLLVSIAAGCSSGSGATDGRGGGGAPAGASGSHGGGGGNAGAGHGGAGGGGASGTSGGSAGTTGGSVGTSGASGTSGGSAGTTGGTGGASGTNGGSGGASGGSGGRGGASGNGGGGSGGASGGSGGRGGASGNGGGGSGGAGGGSGGRGGAGGNGGGGSGGAAGTVASGGSGGAAGNAGTSGSAGTTGTAGTSGSGGTSGTAGTTGSAGTGGSGGSCADGFVDCNGFSVDGCETDIRNDPKHCGACATACPTGALCLQKTCSGALTTEGVYPLAATAGGGFFESMASLVVDASDTPYAGFTVNAYGNGLPPRYAMIIQKRTGAGVWSSVPLPASLGFANTPGFTMAALALGAAGEICYSLVDLSQGTCVSPPTSGSCTGALIFGCAGGPTASTLLTPSFVVGGTVFDNFWTSLLVDPLGKPIVAYGPRSDLRVLYNSDDLVDAAGDGYGMSLRQDSTGALQAAYLNSSNQPTYATWQGAAWTHGLVGAGGATANESCVSMALDGARRPHVLYSDATTNRLLLAAYDGVSWVTSPVRSLAAGETAIGACALALDAADLPHIAYIVQSNVATTASLNYAIYNGSGWSTATLRSPPLFSGGTTPTLYPQKIDLVLGAAGKPHILLAARHTWVTPFSDVAAFYAFLQ